MNPFLTLEDVNSTIRSYGVNVQYHEIDTSLIGDYDFTDVKYDFCTITRIYRNNKYNFYVTIDNNFWTGGYYVLKTNHEILSSTNSYDDGVLYIGVEEEPTIIIGLVLQADYTFDDNKIGKKWLDSNIVPITLNELNTSKSIRVWHFQQGEEETYSLECDTIGVKEIGVHNINAYIVLMKTDFVFNCTQTVTVGKVNKVYLGADSKYKPSGSMVGSYTPTINVLYNDELIPVTFDGTDYYFELDLTKMTETHRVPFYVVVDTNEVLNQSVTKVVLNSQYITVNTFDSLLSAVQNSDVIRLGANITATTDIPIKRSVKIIGNDKTLNLAGYGFILDEDIEFKIENLSIQNGETSILQRPNTKVELTNVNFTECQSSKYDSLGSCIYCDNKYESLSESEDFITILNDCTFTNNSSCILHGGQLTINNCRFHNTNVDFFDKHNPAFLYQTDGNATIQNSIFDIDITDTQLCSEETNMGYAQCIFICGETATINNTSYNELTSNNLDTFFNNPYNNRTHIYTKYYLPQIETCVYTTPIPNMEDKAFCYGLSGDDTIHKINCQVTRSSRGNENTTRKISW